MLRTDKGKPDTTARHVLQVLAEHAHKDGSNARPSVLRIQYRTGYDRRTVQRALRRLEAAKLIAARGVVNGCTSYTLDLTLRRPAADWKALEAEEEELRQATAARVRKHREKRRVTHSSDVTVTHSDDVTDGDVTHSDDVRNAFEVRDVTHSASVRNALNAARTINEPPVEPPGTKDSPAPPATEDADDGLFAAPTAAPEPTGKPSTSNRRPSKHEVADELTAAFWEMHGKGRAQPFIAVRSVIRAAIGNGVERDELARALDRVAREGRSVSGATLDIALGHLKRQRGGSVREPVLTPEDWITQKVEIDL